MSGSSLGRLSDVQFQVAEARLATQLNSRSEGRTIKEPGEEDHDIVTDVDPIQQLRTAAISERLGRMIGSDKLIQAALDALLAGIDSPSLIELAGLGRSEEPEAHDLFNRVIDELALAPTLPAHPTAARWELVRWWCQLIVDGQVPPEVGGRLIWVDGWEELNFPDELQPLVGWVSEWEDWTKDWDVPRDTYRQHIVDAATQLLQKPWPPPNQ